MLESEDITYCLMDIDRTFLIIINSKAMIELIIFIFANFFA